VKTMKESTKRPTLRWKPKETKESSNGSPGSYHGDGTKTNKQCCTSTELPAQGMTYTHRCFRQWIQHL
jgi:hypothetical protein